MMMGLIAISTNVVDHTKYQDHYGRTGTKLKQHQVWEHTSGT